MKPNLERALAEVDAEANLDMKVFRALAALGLASVNLLLYRRPVNTRKGKSLVEELVDASQYLQPVLGFEQSPSEIAIDSMQILESNEPPEYDIRLATSTVAVRERIDEVVQFIENRHSSR